MSNKDKRKKLKNIERQSSGENDEIIRMIKVFAIVAVSLGLFYLVFAIYNGEISFGGDDEEEKVPTEIQNIEILAGSTFNRIEDEYYVLFYDFDGDNASKSVVTYNLYTQKEEHLKMYVVNLGKTFNTKNLASSLEEVNVNSAAELKVMDASLIKVKNGKAQFVISGSEALTNYQATLLK